MTSRGDAERPSLNRLTCSPGRSDLPNRDFFFRINRKRVPQRQAESSGLDLEHVTRFRLDALRKESVAVPNMCTWTSPCAEQAVFEVVIFEVREGVGHVVLTRNKRLFENDLVATTDARGAANIRRRNADAGFPGRSLPGATWNGRGRDS